MALGEKPSLLTEYSFDIDVTTEARQSFARHLSLVAAALTAIEMVDAGELAPGSEDAAIFALGLPPML
jgi:hypothetical protein